MHCEKIANILTQELEEEYQDCSNDLKKLRTAFSPDPRFKSNHTSGNKCTINVSENCDNFAKQCGNRRKVFPGYNGNY